MGATAGQVIAGKYTLTEAFASGGMGSVWRARHTELEIDVAIKFIGSELLGLNIALERFRREARAAALIRSPHVVQLNDYGMHEGVPYIVMEFLEGEDLRAVLRRDGALGCERACAIVGAVAKALRLAHDAGIVHRDLKPANIYLARSGDDEVVKVLDFGVAKLLDADLGGAETTTGAVLGSPLYMSPEQARGARVDHRTDLWALGMVALEIITGEHPLRGAAIGDILVRICTEDMPPPSSRGVVRPGLDAFFARALARDPEARFGSAKELADALSEVCDPRPDRAKSGPARAPSPPRSSSGDAATGAPREPTAALGRDNETLDIVATAQPEATAEAPAVRRSARARAAAAAGALLVGGLATYLLATGPRGAEGPVDGAAGTATAIPTESAALASQSSGPAPAGSLPPAPQAAPTASIAVTPAPPTAASQSAGARPRAPAPTAAAPSRPAAPKPRDPIFGVPVPQGTP